VEEKENNGIPQDSRVLGRDMKRKPSKKIKIAEVLKVTSVTSTEKFVYSSDNLRI